MKYLQGRFYTPRHGHTNDCQKPDVRWDHCVWSGVRLLLSLMVVIVVSDAHVHEAVFDQVVFDGCFCFERT